MHPGFLVRQPFKNASHSSLVYASLLCEHIRSMQGSLFVVDKLQHGLSFPVNNLHKL